MATPGKKYLLLSVPDHTPIPHTDTAIGTESRTMSTFLRLGTPDPQATGTDLLDGVDFDDDTRDRGTNHATRDTVARGGAAGAPGHALTTTERQNETKRIFSRGGWQDHSDGNRVTTTRGDKIEVIRGNYKLLVLGRQDDEALGADFDLSGGILNNNSQAEWGKTEYRWVADKWSGAWKLLELTEKNEVHTTFHGNVTEEFYGDTITTTIGSEAETPPDLDQPFPSTTTPKTKKNRPAITETTFARTITSTTGSSARPVTTISETTWVDTLNEKTYASTINAETGKSDRKVAITDTSYVSSKSEYTYGDSNTVVKEHLGTADSRLKKLESREWVNDKNEVGGYITHEEVTMVAATTTSILMSSVHTDVEIAALRAEIKAGGVFFELEAGILYVEIFAGLKAELAIAGEFKLAKGAKFGAALKKVWTNLTTKGATLTKTDVAAVFKCVTLQANIGLGPAD